MDLSPWDDLPLAGRLEGEEALFIRQLFGGFDGNSRRESFRY